MQECLVYAAVEVSQQDFEGGSMFCYGNKTQTFTKISRHLGTGRYRDLFENEDGEFSINQNNYMLDDGMCKFEDSGKNLQQTVEVVSLVGTMGTSRRTSKRAKCCAHGKLKSVMIRSCVRMLSQMRMLPAL